MEHKVSFQVKIANIELVYPRSKLKMKVGTIDYEYEIDFDGIKYENITSESNTMEFFYEKNAKLQELFGRYLNVLCYERKKNGAKLYVGYIEVDLMDIMTGPVMVERYLRYLEYPVHATLSSRNMATSYTWKSLWIKCTKQRKSAFLGKVSLECSMDHVQSFSILFTSVCLQVKNNATMMNKRLHPFVDGSDDKVQGEQLYSVRCSYGQSDTNRFTNSDCEILLQAKHTNSNGMVTWENPDSFTKTSTFQKIAHSFLHFQVFQTEEDQKELFGECWIPLGKIIGSADLDLNATTRKQVPVVVSNNSTSIWLKGTLKGDINIIVSMENIPEATQMLSGINSEHGVMSVQPLVQPYRKWERKRTQFANFITKVCTFGTSTSKSDDFYISTMPGLPPEMKECIKLFKQLASMLATPHRESAVLEVVNSVLRLLQSTTKTNMLSYSYENNDALGAGRDLLLAVGELLLEYIDIVWHDTKCKFFEIINAILRRSELSDPRQFLLGGDMDYLRLSRSSSTKILSHNGHATKAEGGKHIPSQENVRICVRYRDFLKKLYKYATVKLNVKASYPESRQFCCQILAISFFRLPNVAPKLSDAILPKLETANEHWQQVIDTLTPTGRRFEIPEWSQDSTLANSYSLNDNVEDLYFQSCVSASSSSGVPDPTVAAARFSSNNLTAQARKGNRVNPSLELFNWQHFHTNVERLEQHYELDLDQDLESIELQSESTDLWLKRLKKHGHFFFLFAEEYLRYIFDVVILYKREGRIYWELVPGYTTMLKAFLLEMKRWSIQQMQFSDSMLSLSRNFLVNAQLLAPFTRVLLSRTNATSLPQVAGSLEILSLWIESCSSNTTLANDEDLILWNFSISNIKLAKHEYDAGFLSECMDKLLASEQNQILLNTIMFMYTNWNNFSPILQADLSQVVLKQFNRLMTHWSYLTRDFFHHLIVFRMKVDQVRPAIECLRKLAESDVSLKYKEDEIVRSVSSKSKTQESKLKISTDEASLGPTTVSAIIIQHDGLGHVAKCATIPSFQYVYLKKSLEAFDILMQTSLNIAEVPKLKWHTVVLEDMGCDPIDNK